MFNFLKLKSSPAALSVPAAPSIPIEFEKLHGSDGLQPSITHGKVLLWTYLRALSEICRTPGENRITTINTLYDHFIAYFGVAKHEVTRRQFGKELHRWIREDHLPLRATKPHASAAHVEGVDVVTLNLAFKY